jgi:hypothetical protein
MGEGAAFSHLREFKEGVFKFQMYFPKNVILTDRRRIFCHISPGTHCAKYFF